MNRNQFGTSGAFTPDISSVELTDEKLKEMAEETTQAIIKTAVGTDGMNPQIMVHYREMSEDDHSQLTDLKQMIVVIATDFNDQDVKYQVLQGIGRKCYSEHMIPCAVFMASEAWMSTQTKKEVDEKGFTRPSEDPKRKEILIVSGMTISKDVIGTMIPIRRDENGLIVQDGEPDSSMQCEAYLLSHFFVGYFNGVGRKHG